MSVQTTPHLNFRGDARAALELYRSVFGGELVVTTYGDLAQTADPATADLVVWGQVSAPSGFRVMAYDVPADRPWSPGEAPFFVSVRGEDVEEVRGYWDALADGSTVVAPLASSDWAPAYGMLTDRFGVTWVLDVAAPR
ncbi:MULTISPECIES: VOC family protein [Cellulosimicrobium]|uniref:VOC family protein n=1 Tax=Cellulosimicrobium TaxID=157920 RepID=UPI0020406639|nr:MULTISPECIES: VOC family protein [Cellulosimicrobium]MCM3533184.1 VOC family protein [Cellulosimicrobium funkei]MDQ8042109.1 VOC family protein [Cellulosimicrobium sp. XJ-DQ-B-000]